MRKTTPYRSILGMFLIALAVLGTPALLIAHARLLRSTPAANAKLATLPAELGLWFSERPELRFTTIQLTDSAGRAVEVGPVASVDSNGVRVAVKGAMHAGRYSVAWRTAASDGHASSGKFSFTVDAESPVPPPAASTPAASAPTAITSTPAVARDTVVPKPASNAPIEVDSTPVATTAMRWAELVALLTLIGTAVFRLAVVPAAKWDSALVTDVNDRTVRLARSVLVLLALATISRAVAQTSLFPATSGSRLDSLLMLVQHSRWGMGWAVGDAGVIITLAGLLVANRPSLAGWAVAAFGMIVVCVSEALTGHAGAVRHSAIAIAADVAHVLGAGGWLGGLTAVLLCGMPTLKRAGAASADAGVSLLRAFHGAATECVAIVVVSALVAMWTRFPTVSAIWTTAYGQMLLRKTFFVVVVAGFGLYHWRRVVLATWSDDVRLRFQRSAIAELVFGAVVVAFTALLISQQLP